MVFFETHDPILTTLVSIVVLSHALTRLLMVLNRPEVQGHALEVKFKSKRSGNSNIVVSEYGSVIKIQFVHIHIDRIVMC